MLALILAGLLEFVGLWPRLELVTVDERFRHGRWQPQPLSDDLCLVEIDDHAIANIGRWPWPRSAVAGALQEIHRAGARTVAIDVLFTEHQSFEHECEHEHCRNEDQDLIDAVAAGVTVLADEGTGKTTVLPGLQEAARDLGFVHFVPDPDGGLRTLSLVRNNQGEQQRQLGFAAAVTHRSLLRASPTVELSTWLDRGEPASTWIAWPTTANGWQEIHQGSDSLKHYSLGFFATIAQRQHEADQLADELDRVLQQVAGDVLGQTQWDPAVRQEATDYVQFLLEDAEQLQASGDLTADLHEEIKFYRDIAAGQARRQEMLAALDHDRQTARQIVSDKLVFVGMTATGLLDTVKTPLHPQTPGVIANAVIADMALAGRTLSTWKAWPRWLVAGIGGLFVALIGCFGSLPLVSAVWFVVSGSYLVAAVVALTTQQVLVPMVLPFAAWTLTWLAVAGTQAVLAQRDRRRMERQFGARTAPQLVEYLTQHPQALSMHGEERRATILFLDLAGFTSVSERIGCQASVQLLNRYLGSMTRCLIAHDAYVNKFLGDGLMAFWSAFGEDAEQADQAVRAATDCMLQIDSLNAAIADAEPIRLTARIGIATGTVIVGDCGAPPELNDFTAIGDAVNLAARLESANKQFNSQVLMDHETYQDLSNADGIRFLGSIVVVGQTRPVKVYELLSAVEPMEQQELTRRAIAAYHSGDLHESQRLWEQVQAAFGPSELNRIYLAQIAQTETPTPLRLTAK